MKKTLLAAALTLGFAGVAQAETSVTLYGILDGGIGYQQIKGNSSYDTNRTDLTNFKATKTGMINGVQSGNRWGLKGVEDLGDGLRVVFQLESGFDLGTGFSGQSGRLFGRQATVGLAGDSWGQLDIGRQTNIASKYLPGVADPFGASFGQANIGAAFTAANTVRYDNMIMYQTPNFSGFQFGAGYSFNTSGAQQFKLNDQQDPNTRGITTGLRYANGPIGVALTYDQVKNPGTNDIPGLPGTGTDSVTVKSWNIGGSYDFEVVKAYLAYGQTRNGLFAGESFGVLGTPLNSLNADGLKVNSYLVGLSAPIGNGNLMASWQMADARSAPDSWDAVGTPDRELKKQQTYSLGYTYGLSKRTNVYAIGSYAKNAAFLPDAKSTVLGVGIRHQF
ncbi:MAG: porin [Burkholderiaceae bacterium]|nr:porin [Burkholderiaceae bacterium]